MKMMIQMFLFVVLFAGCATTPSVDEEFPDSLWKFPKPAPVPDELSELSVSLEKEDCKQFEVSPPAGPTREEMECLGRNKAREELQAKLDAARAKQAKAGPAPRRGGDRPPRRRTSSGAEFFATVAQVGNYERAIEVRFLSLVRGKDATVCVLGVTGDYLPVEGGERVYADLKNDGSPSLLPYTCAPASKNLVTVKGANRGQSITLIFLSPLFETVEDGEGVWPVYGDPETKTCTRTWARGGVEPFNAPYCS